jgi:tetratricopeptide (TPR) repeat protein
MSKKRKHGGVKQGFDLFERAQRELAKGNAKDALKDAKVCYREDPSPERRQLLERAYCARAEQLQKAGLNDQARSAFGELTELGITSPEVQAQLPRLRILIGLTEAGTAGDAASLWEANPELLIELADRAVFHRQQVPDKYVEIHGDCQRIRAALEAVERGNDAAAMEQLNDISRRSPCADWKLFVRGLAAFYQGDAERAHANWDRLEPKRPAFRIAQTLLVHSGQLAAESAAFNVANGLRRLEYALEGDPVWEQLKVMGEHFQADHWSGLFHAFRSFCQRFANTHAALIERITDMLWKRMVRDRWDDGLNRLMRIAPAPRLDPRWNRARALLAEASGDASFETVEDYWKAYIRDLTQGDFLPEDERGIAAGLVCQRMARAEVEAAHNEEARRPSYFPSFFVDQENDAEAFRSDALRHYQQSIKFAPQLHSAYVELAKLHLEEEAEAQAVKVYQSLLKHFPDDYATHLWLANYYLEDDKPDKAERYAREAQRLKPRDPATVTLMWSQRFAMVRMCAKKRKFAMARQEWELLAQHMPPDTELYWLDLLRAAVEYKANNTEEAEQYVAAAEAKLKEPAPAWMVMHAHAARFGLSREVKNQFGNRFKAAVAGACCSETAGQLAKVLYPFVAKQLKYTGLATHQRLTLDYLQRCHGVQWNSDDLRHAVQFLRVADSWRHRALRDRLLAEGCARFPQDPLYPYLTGCVAMQDGPYRVDPVGTRKHFELALKLNETAARPLSDEWVKLAKQSMSMLDEAAEMQRSRFYGGPLDEDEDYEEYEDEDEFYDDEEDGPAGGPMNFADLKGMMPRVLMGALQRVAEDMDVSIEEVMRQIMTGELGPEDVLGGLGPPAPHGPFGGPSGGKQKASRR